MNEIKFNPVNGRVIVEKSKEVYDKTQGGLYIPTSAKDQEKLAVGFVVSFDSKEEHPLNEVLKVGMKVVFNQLASNEYKEDPNSKPYYIMMKDTILLVYKDEA